MSIAIEITGPFIWEWCETCDKAFIRCPKCNNNCCNATYGQIDGQECDVCPEAYAVQDAAYKADDVPSRPFIEFHGGIEAVIS